MKQKIRVLCALALTLSLTACTSGPKPDETGSGAPAASEPAVSSAQSVQPDTPQPQSEAERQLATFAEGYPGWRVQEDLDWWGYAVTDLDQDGALEIISSECHGTGHYMTTSVCEIDSYHSPFSRLTWTQSDEPELTLAALSHGRPVGALPLLGPNLNNSGEAQTYPAYYDPAQNAYFYPYSDTISIKDEWYGTFTTLRAFSLNCGEIPGISLGGKPSGILLGCERVTWTGTYTIDDHWNWNGAYIDHETYEGLAERYFSGYEPKEVRVKWIEDQDLDALTADEIYSLLKDSWEAFSIQ